MGQDRSQLFMVNFDSQAAENVPRFGYDLLDQVMVEKFQCGFYNISPLVLFHSR